MSYAKKVAQAARREAKKAMGGYRDALHARLTVFNDILKPKPRFVPNFFWRWLSGKIIDVEKLQNFLNPQTPKKQ